MISKHSKPLERGAQSKGVKTWKLQNVKKPSEVIVTRNASFEGMRGVGAKKNSMQYTGTEMLGVSQMHKSNAVPVFKKEAAIEISQMRRG